MRNGSLTTVGSFASVVTLLSACASSQPSRVDRQSVRSTITTSAERDTAATALSLEIAKQDSLYFDAQFIACDPAKVGTLITRDFEFYHDQAGIVATSDTAFVRLLKSLCGTPLTLCRTQARTM